MTATAFIVKRVCFEETFSITTLMIVYFSVWLIIIRYNTCNLHLSISLAEIVASNKLIIVTEN